MIFFLFFNKVPSSLLSFFLFKLFLSLCFCNLLINLSPALSHKINSFLSLSFCLLNQIFLFWYRMSFGINNILFLLFYNLLFLILLNLDMSLYSSVNFFSGHLMVIWILVQNLIINKLPFVKNRIQSPISFPPCKLYQISNFQAALPKLTYLCVVFDVKLLLPFFDAFYFLNFLFCGSLLSLLLIL